MLIDSLGKDTKKGTKIYSNPTFSCIFAEKSNLYGRKRFIERNV